jgi:hypothetical protein
MNPEALVQWIGPLPLAERAKALTLISSWLTIYGRDYGVASVKDIGESSALKKLVGINELHHKLLSQTGNYLNGEERKVYPVDVFSRILFEVADQYGVRSALTGAMKHAQPKTAPSAGA